MIYIYCDIERFTAAQPDEQTWVADDIGEYIALRKKLRLALDDEDHDFTVYLHSPLLVKWIADLRDYDEKIVAWKTIDVRWYAQDFLGFPIPDELDNSAIRELNVMYLEPPVHTSDPDGWFLKQYLGPVWEVMEPDVEHLAKFVVWAASYTSQLHPALSKLAKRRLEKWSQGDQRYAYFSHNEWNRAARNILMRWIFHRYPEDFVDRLGWAAIPIVNIDKYPDDCIESSQKRKLAAEIRRYWSLFFARKERSFTQHIEGALVQMSGLIEDELEAMYDYLSKYPANLSLSILEQVRNRFRLLPTGQTILDRLEELVPPKAPTVPDDQWEASRWLQWVTEEYIPYFAWIVRANQPRQALVPLIDRFSDWFVSQYSHLLFDPHSPLLLTQQSYVSKLMQDNPNSIVLWAIIDGLTWWQGKLLVDECKKRRLYIHRQQPALSALPSITSVSKRSLAMGYVSPTESQRPIAKVMREQLASSYDNVAICSEPKELLDSVRSFDAPGICVLLYNALDAHNHESSTFTDDESVKGYLRATAEALTLAVDQARRWGFEAHVIISSDHGSTLLPEDAVKLEMPAFLQMLDDEGEGGGSGDRKQENFQRNRACKITRELRAEEVSLLKKNWYILDKAGFGLADTLLVPKGYAYVKRRPRGWIHGGATPEETVVPFIELRPQPLQALEPEVRFEGYLLPGRSNSISIIITNPNPFPLTKLRFEIANEKQVATLSRLAANNSAKLDFPVPPVQRDGRATFEWTLRCEVVGNIQEFGGEATLPVRRMQVSEVDDLFKEMP
jgi:hypothetical protein